MKRIRGKPQGTGKFVQVISQVSYQRKPYYKTIRLMSVHEIVRTPSYGNNLYGKVWIIGDGEHPVVLFRHEYRNAPNPNVKRVRKIPIVLKRVRKNPIKIKRRRLK